MIISDINKYSYAFVWIWLPGKTKPIVAGKLTTEDKFLVFNYGRSYLERKNAIPIFSGTAKLPNWLSKDGQSR